MSNELQVFNYQDREVRTVEIDGEAWFVGKDIADILGYARTRDAIRDHVDDRDKQTRQIAAPSNGGYANMVVINESGLFSLIFSSKLPTAKEFKHWVTSEVLPSIYKSGIYMTDKAADAYLNNPESFKAMAERCSALEKRIAELNHKVDEMYPLHILGAVVAPQKGAISFKDAADLLAQYGIDIGQNRLFKKCREKKLLCSRKGRQWNKPSKAAIDKGLFALEISGGFNFITVITTRGLQFLADMFVQENYPLFMLLQKNDD